MKLRMPNGIVLDDVTEEFALRLMRVPQETKVEPDDKDKELAEDFATEDELEQAEKTELQKAAESGKLYRKKPSSIHDKIEQAAKLIAEGECKILGQALRKVGIESNSGNTNFQMRKLLRKVLKKKYGIKVPKRKRAVTLSMFPEGRIKKGKKVMKEKDLRFSHKGSADRLTWIHARIKTMSKALPNLSWEDYFNRASLEWGFRKHVKEHKNGQPAKAVSSPLQLLDNHDYNQILNQILERVVSHHGIMTWQADSFAIGIEDYQAWKDLLMSLLKKGETISDWFKGNAAFHLEQHENRAALHYY